MSYAWIFPPLMVAGYPYDKADPSELSYDELNNAEVMLRAADIPEESRDMYDTRYFTPEALALDPEEQPDVEVIQGFFLRADTDLDHPTPGDLFIAYTGPERRSPGRFCPDGEEETGHYGRGDRLISVEDYLQISGDLPTPALFLNPLVREDDPYRQIGRMTLG